MVGQQVPPLTNNLTNNLTNKKLKIHKIEEITL